MDPKPRPLTDSPFALWAEMATEFSDAQFAPIEELRHEPPAARPTSTPLAVDLWTLAHFKSLMAREGWPVQVARMLFDRVYAHERLAFAHSSSSEPLRRMALDIFRRMHAQDGQALSHRH